MSTTTTAITATATTNSRYFVLGVTMIHFDAVSEDSNNATANTIIPTIAGVISLGRREDEVRINDNCGDVQYGCECASCDVFPTVQRMGSPALGTEQFW